MRAAHIHTHRLSEALFVMRRRRQIESADVLLDECLALLDAVAHQSPQQRVPHRLDASRSCVDSASSLDEWQGDYPGYSRTLDQLRKDIATVARDAHVSAMITGEPGTGKERVARAIHALSSRATAPFIAISCADFTPDGAVDELVGHRRGSRQCARSPLGHAGAFERASGGTILLADLEHLPRHAQSHLARMLREAEDVRVLASTSVDLSNAVRNGQLRNDLYYRLSAYELAVPALRARGDAEIRRLAEAILNEVVARRRRPLPTVASDAWECLARYSWPGNVPELENVLEHMVVAAGDATSLTAADIPDYVRRGISRDQHSASSTGRPIRAASSAVYPSVIEARGALERNNYQYGRTASELGLSRHQLYRLLKRCATIEASADRELA